MPIYYCTFGYGHIHPITSEKMQDYWVEIEAENRQKAEYKMMQIYGKKWAMCYDKLHWETGSFPKKGCYQKISAIER